VKERRFPLLAFVRVNPDSLRRCLPEWHLYNKQNPELAGELTMKEAGYMAEILTLAGLQAGKNVIVDGSLRRAHWYREYFAYLREEFPELRIAIIHVTAPRDAVFRRAAVSASLDICLLFDFCLGLIAYLFFWRSRKEHS
jgi:predicted kinase